MKETGIGTIFQKQPSEVLNERLLTWNLNNKKEASCPKVWEEHSNRESAMTCYGSEWLDEKEEREEIKEIRKGGSKEGKGGETYSSHK